MAAMLSSAVISAGCRNGFSFQKQKKTISPAVFFMKERLQRRIHEAMNRSTLGSSCYLFVKTTYTPWNGD
jgi:hypothetical protein